MAATVTSAVVVTLRSILANSAGLASASASIETGINQALASGVGATQADRIYSESQKSIVGAYSPDLSGALLDALGAACVFARVRAILVVAAPGNSGDVIVGGDANAFMFLGAAASTLTVKPGGVLFLYAPAATGYVVTAATGDILKFAPSAGTQVFDFAILGCSA
jgi:hypothetical protein